MDCLPVQPARLDPRLCGRGETNEVKALRTDSRCSSSNRKGQVSSAPTKNCAGARPSGRFTEGDFLGRGLSVMSPVGATQKRRKRRTPVACLATRLHSFRTGESQGEGRFVRNSALVWHLLLLERLACDPAATGRHLYPLLFVWFLFSPSARAFAASAPIRFAGQD